MWKAGMTLGALVLTVFFVQQALALTADQVMALKKAGISDQTIQLMIRQEMKARQNNENEAGMRDVKDKDGNVVTVYSAGDYPESLDAEERQNVDRAWEILNRVIIDGRK